MVGKVTRKLNKDREVGARASLLEELFSDFYTSRRRVYGMNFVRGIFFGVGSVVGGTLVVALLLAALGWLADVPGWFGDVVQYVVETVRDSK